MRFAFFCCLSCLWATLIHTDACLACESREGRPNIVFILADDLGYADLGVHGCPDIPTPNIDRLAADGVRLTDAYSNGSFCGPTRAALVTCRYQHRCGKEDNTGPVPLGVSTLAERLQHACYTTAIVGKWHLGKRLGYTPVDCGFEEFFGFLGGGHRYFVVPEGKGEYNAPILRNRTAVKEDRYLTTAFGEEAAGFIERQRESYKPFFLYLAFNAPHSPLEAPEKYRRVFDRIKAPRRRTYAAMVNAMDDAVGLVLNALSKNGTAENTLVIFHNDNGGPTTRNAVNGSCNYPLRGSKGETFEGGIRVPTFMKWPNVIPEGDLYTKPVITSDLSATILAAAGADTSCVDGVNLIPFVNGDETGSPHEALFWRSRTMNNNYAVRKGDWKYVHSTEGARLPGPKQKAAVDMLFNLAEDVEEQNNLAAERPEKLAELKRLYEQWSTEVDADCRELGVSPAVISPHP